MHSRMFIEYVSLLSQDLPSGFLIFGKFSVFNVFKHDLFLTYRIHIASFFKERSRVL